MDSTYRLLSDAAQRWPEHIGVIDGEEELSYQQLFQQAELLKNKLLENGLTQGMGLAVMGRNSSAFIVAMFAGFACGATVFPLSHQLKQSEIEHILSDTQLHAVLDDQSGLNPVEGEAVTIDVFQHTLRLAWTGISFESSITPLNDAAFIRYTSGTTGSSKGVVLTHKSIAKRVEIAQAALQLTSNDVVLWVLSMAFHFLVTILVYIRSGAKIILCKDLLAQTIINDANNYNASFLYASPMHFRLLAADSSGKTMQSLKIAISTSSGIPINIANAFKDRFNLPVTQAYGIIEAGLPLMDNLSEKIETESVGYPVPGFLVSIYNDNKQQVVVEGEIGHLAITGAGMFDAYLKPWQTAEQVMVDGWFMTGDLAKFEKDGLVTICGREKTMINVSGNKVFPEEVEVVLNSHEDILEAHVFGHNHSLMGEIVCANVRIKENIELDVENVLKFCRHQLSYYKVPQQLNQVAKIVHTQSGKIKRVD
ncbi:MAG: acyl--CoA ligase [Methylococcaceae bacterium]|nr:acyl--CoA ligase [Methylococcaceae bacterium]